nr:putative ribonuclease h protein [Quercus suber]
MGNCLWDNFWLPSGPLRKLIKGTLTEGENNLSVKMFLSNPNGISFNLPANIINDIQSIPIASNPEQKDRLVWAFSKDGFFSLKSAYLLAKGLNPLNLDTQPCRWVWDVYTTLRIKFFLWLSSQNSIPTREVLGSRGFNLCTTCDICGNAAESTIHALRDCPGAKKVWTELGIIDTNQVFLWSSPLGLAKEQLQLF